MTLYPIPSGRAAFPRRPKLLLLLCLAAGLSAGLRAADTVLITEFMAANSRTLADEDGEFSDWLELYNAGTNTVNLGGWYLTDDAGRLDKWQFPATNLPVNSYLVVFASNKNRRTPGRPLHTNFRLTSEGEYLALVQPDRVTIASSYAPAFPMQVDDISYGIPVTLTPVTLLATGAAARVFVPFDGGLGPVWTLTGFDDGAWSVLPTGLGYESDVDGPAATNVLADSAGEFSGTQGANSWFYGYWSKKADADGVYDPATDFTLFPRGGTTWNATNFWTGSKWDWFAGDPPFTEITSTGARPSAENGNPALPVHWPVRRYVSETNGALRITGTLFCSSSNGLCGDGVVGRIFVDGVEVYQQPVFGLSLGYSIIVPARLGALIDFVVDPGPATNDLCDSTIFTATIRQAGTAALVADSMADWSLHGTQGERNWSYGYFNRSNDPDKIYQATNFTAFPSAGGPHSSVNFWTGEAWHWFDGDPPHTHCGQVYTVPNLVPGLSSDKADEHWVIRRWVSEVAGTLLVDWHLAKQDPTGSGVSGRVLHNGTARDAASLAASDTTGVTRSVVITNVKAGDFIDFAVDPGAEGIGDGSFFNVQVFGYPTLSNQFVSNVETAMRNVNSSLYLRLPFTVADPAAFNSLRLRMKYDDGFIAWLNGTPVARANAPEEPFWDSTAIAAHSDADGAQFESFDLSELRDLLQVGTNVLAIQALNVSATDTDFLVLPELVATTARFNAATPNYFALPTPGTLNGVGNTNLAPLVLDVVHTPNEPQDNEDLVVTARVVPTFNPVGTVRLYWRVMFGTEGSLVMLDDGLHADGAPGDGVFGATLSSNAASAGQMIRYYILASDSRTNYTRSPPYPDPTASAQYFGTVVADPTLTNPLPVFHWFVQNPAAAATDAGTKASVFYLGEFYDNIGFRLHGQSSRSFPKKSYNVDFNPDHHFRYATNAARVDDINMLTPYPDKAHMRNALAYETHRDSGCAYHWVVPVRVQTNGGFCGDWHLVENGDAGYLKRVGLDPNGAFYKGYDTMADVNTAEKKTRRNEDRSDLAGLYAGASLTGTALAQYLFDNVDVAQVVNYLASMIITANRDCCHKNWYVYRDTEGTRLWEMLPWDVDLSFGRNWSSSLSYWDDGVYPANALFVGSNAKLPAALFNTPATRQMYLRRIRTLMEELLQTDQTPYRDRYYENRIDELAAQIMPDAALDLAKWGTWGNGSAGPISTSSPYYKTMPESVSELKTNYLPARRTLMFSKSSQISGAPELPDAQPTNATILFGAIEFNPASANQAEEYIQFLNTNTYAVDISGWRLAGGVDFTFQGGVVMPANSALYVSPDQVAFRARATPPRSGQGLFIQGNYRGQLSARGELLELLDKAGRVVRSTNYPGNPSLAQLYLRITELMYHPPPPPAGSPYTAEDFEFIELKNIGPTNLNLTGVHFSAGVEFTFTGSSVTSLGPGEAVLVVKNLAAFTARYGSGFRIAGQYTGSLDNSGETLRLDDAMNEKVLEFTYNDSWYPITDGPGCSLVIRDENAPWDTWDARASWRPSRFDGGSPGATDGLPASPPPVLVNEVLSNSDPPLTDAIELHNPGPNDVAIGGWFLSDDFETAKKFRIPDGTVVPAGGFVVFYETNFNPTPGVPPSFAFSAQGEEAYLFSGDGANLTGWVHGFGFGAADSGVTFGRHVTSVGAEHFVAQSARSLGAANAGPRVGPVVLTEIMYRPPDLRGGVNNTDDEFLELLNITGTNVPLFDLAFPTNTWRVRGAVTFVFPTNVTLVAGGYLLLVNFNPADTMKLGAFRAKYGVPVQVPIFGPYSGNLDNGGGTVALYKPGPPSGGVVPEVLVEAVDYDDQTPWPASADGAGASLQRRVASAYGNDPANWLAAVPTAAATAAGGAPPVITMQPASGNILFGSSASLSVTASGSPPLFYQWRYSGANIAGATNATYVIPRVRRDSAGAYSVLVFNAAGSAESSSAVLTVLVAAVFITQPQSQAVFPFHNVTFSASASGSAGMSYQWRFNGADIPGATNTTYSITNVQAVHEGDYTVAVTDPVATIVSDPARLTVLLHPVFTLQPSNTFVRLGAAPTNATLFAQAVSSTPVRYQWLFNGTNLPGASDATLTLTNVQLANGGDYAVVATDSFGSLASSNATLAVLVLPYFTGQPESQIAFEGETVAMQVSAYGSMPLSFRWRRSGATVTNFIVWSTNSLYTIPSVKLTDAGTYSVVLTNLAGAAPLSSNALLQVFKDVDGDRVGDSWETLFGLDPADPADGDLDPDGDGLSNREEFLAGTDPTNALSCLRIDTFSLSNAVVLTFQARSNRTYTVQYTDGLTNTGWQWLQDVFLRTTNRTEIVTDPSPPAAQRLYRLVTPRQP